MTYSKIKDGATVKIIAIVHPIEGECTSLLWNNDICTNLLSNILLALANEIQLFPESSIFTII